MVSVRAKGVVSFAIVIALFLLRQHIFILGEVLYTYAVFPYQQLNYYEYPVPAGNAIDERINSPRIVPTIMHQILLAKETVPAGEEREEARVLAKTKYARPMDSCRLLHGNWTIYLWDDDSGDAFVAEQYPGLLPDYLGYPQTIQRANILRYLVLHHYGGVYLDLDLVCRSPLNDFLHLPWLTPGAYPAGINNAFIVSKPNHPFLTALISRIKSHNVWWPLPYVANMLSTGCMFISMAYTQSKKDDLWILGGHERHFLRGHVVTPLFEHLGASSWHGWDAAVIIWIGTHRIIALSVVISLMAAVTLLIRQTMMSGRRRSLQFARSLNFKQPNDRSNV